MKLSLEYYETLCRGYVNILLPRDELAALVRAVKAAERWTSSANVEEQSMAEQWAEISDALAPFRPEPEPQP